MVDARDTHIDIGDDPARVTWADGTRVRVIEDWATIWQSEMAGLLVDREVQEALLRAGEAWAAPLQAMAALWADLPQPQRGTGGGERTGGRAGANAAAGATAADAAPDGPRDAARDALIERLLQRVAELERRAGVPCPACAGAGRTP